MCIIIHKPKGSKLDKATYEECFRHNDDGAGIAYVDAEFGLVVEKGFFKFKHLYKRLSQIEDGELLIHFRIQTHGGISKSNCHPFVHRSENFPQYSFAMAHNGQLPYRSTPDKSDTACFAAEVLFPHLDRDPWFLDSATGRFFLETFMTSRNKMVVMRFNDKTGEVTTTILNEKEGNRDRGCWFSNTSWKPYVAPSFNYRDHEHYSEDHDQQEFRGYGGSQAWGTEWENLKDMDKCRQGWLLDDKGQWRRCSDPRYDTKASKNEEASSPPTTPPLPQPGDKPPLASVVADAIKKAQAEAKEAVGDAAGRIADKPAVEYIKEGPLQVDGKIVPFTPPKEIVVPRDRTALVCANLNHLTPEDRKTMHGLCASYLQFLGLKDPSGMTLYEQLSWVRDDLRDARPEFRDKTDQEIDAWLVAQQMNAIGMLKVEMMQAHHA